MSIPPQTEVCGTFDTIYMAMKNNEIDHIKIEAWDKFGNKREFDETGIGVLSRACYWLESITRRG